MPRRAGDLRELLGELGAHLAQVLQLAVVVVQQPRIHQPLPVCTSAICTRAGLEIELGAQEQLERHRLGPQVAADLDADHVVVRQRRRLAPSPTLRSVFATMRGSKSMIA